MPSAPEQVRRLEPLWTGLAEERVRALSLRWVDRSIRSMLADGFEKASLPNQAMALRNLRPIDDDLSLLEAKRVLDALDIPDQAVDVLAAYFDAAATLKELVESLQIFECCFLAVMVSRLVHGDDRAVELMKQDLLGASQ